MGSIPTCWPASGIQAQQAGEPWLGHNEYWQHDAAAYACDTFSSPANFRKLVIAREPNDVAGPARHS